MRISRMCRHGLRYSVVSVVFDADDLSLIQGAAAGGAGSGGAAAGDSSSGGGAAAAEAAANVDKELRKLIASLEMSFNSGIANVKKVLDDNKDAPQLLVGKAPGLTSTVSTMDLKVKKGIMDLKRKLMDLGKSVKKEEL